MRPCFVVPYAFGVDVGGQPDAEARARLDKAIQLGRSFGGSSFPTMFLGAGMPERTKRYGVASLAACAKTYLESKGWPPHRIVQQPKGYSTVSETLALYEYLKDILDLVEIHVVTSWWHVPRVWMACRLVFGFDVQIKFYAATSGHSNRALMYDVMREIIALPRSAFMAWCVMKDYEE